MYTKGDKVVAKKHNNYAFTQTERRHGYTQSMRIIAENQSVMTVEGSWGDKVYTRGWVWHKEDLEHYNLNLENE
jgi:hypothetical protein